MVVDLYFATQDIPIQAHDQRFKLHLPCDNHFSRCRAIPSRRPSNMEYPAELEVCSIHKAYRCTATKGNHGPQHCFLELITLVLGTLSLLSRTFHGAAALPSRESNSATIGALQHA